MYIIIKLMKILFILIQILLITSIYAEGNPENFDSVISGLYSHTVDIITTSEFAARIDAGEKILLIDTRSKSEYDVSYIQGAHFVDYEAPDLLFLKDLPLDSRIILYCTVGYRSEKIGEMILEQGFTHVFNLYGGITQWINDGYTVYDREGETRKIHGYSKEWGRWINTGEVVY